MPSLTLEYGFEATAAHDGTVFLNYLSIFSVPPTLATPVNFVNSSAMILNLTGSPKIKSLGGKYASDGSTFTDDPIPEISIASILADSLGAAPLNFSIDFTNITNRQGTFRKRYRIRLQDPDSINYYFDFIVEGVITS